MEKEDVRTVQRKRRRNRPQPHQVEPAGPSFIHHAAPLRPWRVTGPVAVTVTEKILRLWAFDDLLARRLNEMRRRIKE
ncbi:hypothetical protein RRG08_012897 [Elysia crispata]|uniref:Uncharacterized protein n=1 Tax=Elysia crispata TaxID=231223 RepID=A0AAE0YH44_9GAST|nr:hypothetical protein RRG08_012897 [Elysia crispata]